MTIVDIADTVFLQAKHTAINFSFLATAEIKPARLIRTFLLGDSVPVLVAELHPGVPPDVESQLLGEHERRERNGS